ncbi:hypothetical protein PRIPAC_77056 [Pristionchus pacificus]|uniref:Uncharacterized protein n=1 Tax=Pristionchus pacificus TaxID=54126 RepID=A0A2A6CKN6_PRIPA|nr:hypothetical protein PRIPAC_77056 [Pristionchus pacificus]|eukprot:PDM78762.1 hypothetical protein PRIPAC_31341 [Pristionchus pacificus]
MITSSGMKRQIIHLVIPLLTHPHIHAAFQLVFVYAPYLLLSDLSLLKFDITIFHDTTAPLSTFFPVLDAAVILLFVTDYRRRYVRLMQRKRPGARSRNERK